MRGISINARHLRSPLGAHEGADGDFLETGLRERIDEADLVCYRNVRVFNLQPIAHAFFGMKYFRVAGHKSFASSGHKYVALGKAYSGGCAVSMYAREARLQ